MMRKKSITRYRGHMSADIREKIFELFDEFVPIVDDISKTILRDGVLRPAIIRIKLPCALLIVLDNNGFFVIGQRFLGQPLCTLLDLSAEVPQMSTQEALNIAIWDFGPEDPFLISFPRNLLNQDEEQRQSTLRAIAQTYVDSESQRFLKMTSLIQINPLFGPASFSVVPNQVFVLMPFEEELTKIYNDIIKPTVEEKGLVCRRADDYKTNKAIMQNIWKAICEARVVIADLTCLNPNVMYELGIAHTVGKETILIYQLRDEEELKFPFDLAHIRRIQYEYSPSGGAKLRNELSETLDSVLERVKLS